MGVPGYFSWIHHKYPYQVRKVKQNGRKKHIDCLYIDLNGICYQYARDEHNYNYLLNPKPLDAIFKQIFDHIDSIIELIDPQVQVYLMMDGTCPRAKMNQQRQRRFHAQHNHVELVKGLKRHGFDIKHETVPNNSISPGTPFMYELNQQMKRYIETRMALNNQAMSQDEANHNEHTVAYKKLQFILSDSNSPGEGEHKILEIIRKHTNLQLTHCIVGADADLLLLSLATIGKRILILRENNKFRAEKGGLDEELDKFKQQLEKQEKAEQVAAPREYDLVDINGLKRIILDKYKKMFDNKQIRNLKYNPMNIMDDFVFLSLFAGNDFLPRQNYMQIKNEKRHEHILDILIDKYDAYLENATDYLSDRGYIKFGLIINFLKLVSEIEPHFKKNNIFQISNKSNEDKTVMEYVKIMSQKQISDVEKVQDEDLIEYQFKEDELQLQQKHSKVEETEIVNDLMSDSDNDEPDNNKNPEKEEKKTNIDDRQKEKTKESHKDHQNEEQHKQKNSKKEKHHKEENDSGNNVDGENNNNKKTPVFEENDEIANILSDELNGKEIYLKEKLQVQNQDEYDLIIMKYLEGFQFTLLYYFRGIEKASWNYYYPHFYAPLIQDTVDFLNRNPKFEVKFIKTQTFQPYKQLLSILHPDNNELLPKEFSGLFKKYLLPFCPEKLEIDSYGATVSHMQIIKLPFIDLKILDKAYEEGEQALMNSGSVYDKNRNTTIKDTLFYYDKNSSITIPVFNKLVHHTQIENAPIAEYHFGNLDHNIPDILANVVVDMEKKNAEKQQYENKKKSKKNFNADDNNEQYEKKGKHHNKNEEYDNSQHRNKHEYKNNNHDNKGHRNHDNEEGYHNQKGHKHEKEDFNNNKHQKHYYEKKQND